MQADNSAPRHPQTRQWVPVPGGRLFVEMAGDGPPLLMIHGWPLDHRIFDAQVEGLRDDMTLLRYDRRGFGSSDAPPDLVQEVDDIDALLDAMGIESAHVLGMSQGGRIALRHAVKRPARVRSLVLQGAAVDGVDAGEDESERIPVQEYADLARQGNLDEVRQRWLRHPLMRLESRFSNEAKLVREILDGYAGQDLLAFKPGGYVYPTDVLSSLPDFRKPVLLLTGATESESRKRHAKALLDRLPDCREIVLEDGGHLCNLTAAAAYNDAVRAFCKAVENAKV